jgi:uncharacterized protein (TIGR03790 family)
MKSMKAKPSRKFNYACVIPLCTFIPMQRFHSIHGGLCRLLFTWFFCCMPLTGHAGGGPQNVLIVANQQSGDSLALGHYYREQRGIPARHFFTVDTPLSANMSTTIFSNQVRAPILSYIASQQLTNQIEYIVFSSDIPYRIYLGSPVSNRFSSLTSSMFYDFKSSPDAFVFDCQTEPGSDHAFYRSERAFDRNTPGHNEYILSAMLAAGSSDGIRQVIDRSVSADHTTPTGRMNLIQTSDLSRMVRRPQYENTQFYFRMLDQPVEGIIRASSDLSAFTNTMGYSTGAPNPGNLNIVQLQPGSIAEHLTSFGGFLTSVSGQMSVTNWMALGASGSYGTIVEPCAITNKFPATDLYYWYARGFNAGESIYMATRNPYQGLTVGDPLTQPYSSPPLVTISGIAPHSAVSGIITAHVHAISSSLEETVHRVDMFLNDRYLATLTNISPRQDNTVSVQLGATTRTYTVGSGESIYSVAEGVANRINQAPPLPYTARAFGDRVEIVQDSLGIPGEDIAFDAFTSIGVASELTVHATPHGTNLLETAAAASRALRLEGSVSSGDVMRVVVTRLDSVVVTNTVTATNTVALKTFFQNYINQFNLDTNLTTSSGVKMLWYAELNDPPPEVEAFFVARTNGWTSYKPDISVQITSTSFFENAESGKNNDDVMGGRATLFIRAGATNLVTEYELDTTAWPDGPYELRAVAYDGSGVRAQGHAIHPFVISNFNGFCEIQTPVNDATFPVSAVITTHVDAALSPGVITSMQFYVMGRLHAETNSPPWTFIWDTTSTGAGRIELQARASGDGGEAIESPIHRVRITRDSDGDDLPDWWEYLYYDSSTGTGPDDDLDADGFTDFEEYIAGTNPTDGNDYFKLTATTPNALTGIGALEFLSLTSRFYRVEWLDGPISNNAPWSAGTGTFFRGNAPVTSWDSANAPAATNAVRSFRVRVRLP